MIVAVTTLAPWELTVDRLVRTVLLRSDDLQPGSG